MIKFNFISNYFYKTTKPENQQLNLTTIYFIKITAKKISEEY
jgi:hypothetical protein